MKYALVTCCFFVMSCGNNNTAVNNTTDTTAKDTTATIAEPVTKNECYQMIKNRDTAGLQLEVSGTVAKGTLQYNLHEKDRNGGTLQGIIRDSLLVADYTFNAEGVTSVRQIVFKIAGDNLLEGYGDIETVHDTARFKNIEKLKFMSDRPFIKKDCEQQ